MTSHSLLNADLYRMVLLSPSRSGDTLLILAGYASPAMLGRLMADVESNISVHLVIGMIGHEGIVAEEHEAYLTLQDEYAGRLTVAYTTRGWSVHTKLYVWISAGQATAAYAGSANFTQNGFLIGWRRARHSEILSAIDPEQAQAEFWRIEGESLASTHPDVDAEIEWRVRGRDGRSVATEDVPAIDNVIQGARSIVLPLVSRSNVAATGTMAGQPHAKWGLNWGADRGRSNRNEAVIPVPRRVWDNDPDFFPRGSPGNRPTFLVTTDDNKSLIMVVAEEGDKALHSLPSNGAIGEYFRNRLGVANGASVKGEDLQKFGSRFVKFYRVDDESFHMEFSPEADVEGAAIYGLPSL